MGRARRTRIVRHTPAAPARVLDAIASDRGITQQDRGSAHRPGPRHDDASNSDGAESVRQWVRTGRRPRKSCGRECLSGRRGCLRRQAPVPASFSYSVERCSTIAGRSFKASIPAFVCDSCGAVYFNGPALGHFDLAVANKLPRAGVSDGEAIRSMRKAVGLPAITLAELLDTSPETALDGSAAFRTSTRWPWGFGHHEGGGPPLHPISGW